MSDIINNEMTEIQAEYVYLTIPAKWVCVYHKLLMYMADYGKTIIDDCSAICKNANKSILSCWNLFQSALACHTLGKDKEADLFIKYIEKQLEAIYQNSSKDLQINTIPLSISKDGKLKAIVSCSKENEVKFYVDAETGILYQEVFDDNSVYSIKYDKLIVETKS